MPRLKECPVQADIVTLGRRRHVGLNHGFRRRINDIWFEDRYEYWREAVTVFDVKLPFIRPKLLPSPEPSRGPTLNRLFVYLRCQPSIATG
jgi:hypothetical protein